MSRVRRTHLAVGAGTFLLLVGGAGIADDALSDPDAELVFSLREQLDSREFTEAAFRAERWIEQRQVVDGRYDISLAQPLVLLGDARMGLEDPAGALDAYDRAKHIVRLANGVQDPGQMDVLYREAEAFEALGQWTDANQRQELAYDISRRAYARDDRRHQDTTRKLIRWYRHHHKYIAAHFLLEQLIDSAEKEAVDESRLIGLLREHARLWRQEMFARRRAGRGQFEAWPPGVRRLPPWHEFFPFREGRAALDRVVAIREGSSETGDIDRAMALLELADWHLLFGKPAIAIQHYRRVWRLLEADPARRAEIFDEPTPIFLPLPRDPGKGRVFRRDPHDGIVQLALTVTHRGNVIGRKTLHAEPKTFMEHRVRMAARKARYRPAFRDGNPVKIRGHPLEFTYTY